MKKKIWFVIYIVLIIAAIAIIVVAAKQPKGKNEDKTLIGKIRKARNSLYTNYDGDGKYYSADNTFYLEGENLYVKDGSGNWVNVVGNFSQMEISDYYEGTYQSKPNIGGVYFYYENYDGDIFYTRSENYKEWQVKNLTTDAGVPKCSEIRYIRIYGNYGLIFYIEPNGEGKIITSSSQGNYWDELETDFRLDDNSQVKFLNEYGMCVDGFISVPNATGTECDLYMCQQLGIDEFKKVEVKVAKESDPLLDYYHIPEKYDNGMTLSMEIGEDEYDIDTETCVLEISSGEWITKVSYLNKRVSEVNENKEMEDKSNQMIDELDGNYFLLDIENYNPDSNTNQISEKKAKEIAEIGFKESAARIAGEGTENTDSETIKIEEVTPNNYFTRKSGEYDYRNFSAKRKAYVITRTNEMGNGVSIYVDVTTGLIIGGDAFGD